MTDRNLRIGLLFAGIATAASLFTLFCFGQLMRKPQLYHDFLIAEDVQLDIEPSQINVSGRTPIDRDVQMVCIRMPADISLDYETVQLLDAKGDLVDPKVAAVDKDGQEHDLASRGSRGPGLICFKSREPLDPELEIQWLRMSSSRPFRASKILWTTYSIKDRK